MQTNIYVDGLNLYYGALKNTPHKWLDLSGLFRDILQPHHDIVKIKYFTSKVTGTANSRRQDVYLNALKAYCHNVEIIPGYFKVRKVKMSLVHPKPRQNRQVDVYRPEEKGTDVNLAVHLIDDAWRDDYDCAVVVSNDSDFAEAVRKVSLVPNKKVGLINPTGNWMPENLSEHAMFVLFVTPHVLKRNQLPSPIPGTNIVKPSNW